MPVLTVDELKNIDILLVQKLSIHEGLDLLKHVGSLMRRFNLNIWHRSFIFLLEYDILKSPNSEMLSYEERKYVSNFWISETQVDSFWEGEI